MGKPKKRMIKTICFGNKNNEERVLIEQFIKENGHGSFSKMVRTATKAILSQHPRYDDFKKLVLVHRLYDVLEQRKALAKKMQLICDDMISKDMDVAKIMASWDGQQ